MSVFLLHLAINRCMLSSYESAGLGLEGTRFQLSLFRGNWLHKLRPVILSQACPTSQGYWRKAEQCLKDTLGPQLGRRVEYKHQN